MEAKRGSVLHCGKETPLAKGWEPTQKGKGASWIDHLGRQVLTVNAKLRFFYFVQEDKKAPPLKDDGTGPNVFTTE